MVEKVEAFKAVDGTVYNTWVEAMKRETFVSLQHAEVGGMFGSLYELMHSSVKFRRAIHVLSNKLKELYGDE